MQIRWKTPSRRAVVITHLLYVALGAWLVLRPVPSAGTASVHVAVDVLHALGWHSVTGWAAEFGLNVALFVPLPLMWACLAPTVSVWVWPTLGFVISSAVESTQWLLLPERSATAHDVVANTAGALLGAVVVWAVRWVAKYLHRRRGGTISGPES